MPATACILSGHRKDGQTDIDLALDAITAAELPILRDLLDFFDVGCLFCEGLLVMYNKTWSNA